MRVFGAGFVVLQENFLFLTASLQNELLVDHSCFLFRLLLLLPQNWIVRVVFGRCGVGDTQMVFHCREDAVHSELGITFVTCRCLYKCHILWLRFSGFKAVVAVLKLWLWFFPSSLPFFPLFFPFFIYFCLLFFSLSFPSLPFHFFPFLPSFLYSELPSFHPFPLFLLLSVSLSPLPFPSFCCSLLLLFSR